MEQGSLIILGFILGFFLGRYVKNRRHEAQLEETKNYYIRKSSAEWSTRELH